MDHLPFSLLPGLWVALLAALLWSALGRWLDPVPWRARVVWSVLLLVLFGPVLFAGKMLLPLGYMTQVPPYQEIWPKEAGPPPGNLLQSDLVLQITPWQVRVREALAAGEWPLWHHLSGAGEPLLANPQAQVLQPLTWPALLFPAGPGAGITAALRVLVALTFTFLLLRRQGLSETPALAGSVAFGLGGGVLLWLGWPMANSPALLPVLLYGIARVGGGGRGGQALLALAVCAFLNTGHPETILHGSLLATAFALSRLAASPREERGRLLGAWALAAALGFGLAAPALLPAAHVLPHSLRAQLLEARRELILQEDPLAGWRTPAERTESGRKMGELLLPVVAPRAFGDNRFGKWWGDSNVNEDAAAFVGSLAVLGAVLSLLAGKGRRFPQERVILGAALIALVVLARPPGLAQLLSSIPVLRDSLTLHHRLLLTLGFCLAYLAACSWERWLRGEIPRGQSSLAAAAVVALFATAYMGWPAPEGLPEDLPIHGIRLMSQLLQIGVIVLAGIALVRHPHPGWIWGLVACSAVELLVHHRPANPAVPARLFYPETPAISFLRERADPWYRIAGIGPPLRPSLATVYGLADPRTSNPAKPADVAHALARINRFPYRATDGFINPRDPLYQLLGVRHLMTPPEQRLPGLKEVWRDGTARIYEVPRPLPRLFLPHAAYTCEPGVSWSDCTRRIGNFRRRAALLAGAELPSGTDGAAWQSAAPRGARLDLREIRPAWIRAGVDPSEPRLLASSLYQDGGWTLLVDGEARQTLSANGPFLAAWLGPGDKDVELIHRPRGFVPGMGIAALALALWVAVWARPPFPRA
jgi:hypothetical protein